MRRKRRTGKKHRMPSSPLSLTEKEISVMLRALSFFENALRHDQRERAIISHLKRKLHDELTRGGGWIGALQP